MDRRKRTARTVALMSLFSMTDTQENVPVASFDGDGSDLISLIVGIDPVQAGSGDPSPDNIRPISGHTDADVVRTGKNLFSSEVAHGLWTTTTFYSHEGASSKYLASLNKIPLVGGRSYVLSFENDPNNAVASGTFVAFRGETAVNEATWINIANGIINVPSGADSIAINLILTNNIKHISELTTKNYQLELGSTATAYEAYQGQTYPIPLGQTVYGGTLDVTQGKLTVDRAETPISGLSWQYQSAYTRFYSLTLRGVMKAAESNTAPLDGLISSIYKTSVVSGGADMSVSGWGSASAGDMLIRDSRFTDVSSFLSAVGSETIVYPLATPIVYDLTPTQVTTLIGTNNIWADTGDIKYIEYNI